MRSSIVGLLSALVVAGCGNPFTAEGQGGAGGTAGSAAAAGTTNAGGTGGGESCLNGVDDDGDELADCDDPECEAGFVCVPPLPQGWTGIGAVGPNDAEPCPAELPDELDLYDEADLAVPAGSCQCTCGPLAGASCASDLTCFTSTSCSGSNNGPTTVSTNCKNVTLPSDSGVSCQPTPPTLRGGSCPPGTDHDIPDPSWPAAARACLRPEPGTCAGSQACVPRPPLGTDAPCIAQSGAHPCPPGYPEQQLFFDGTVADGRHCSPCDCEAPAGDMCCVGACTVRLYALASCLGAYDELTPGSCTVLTSGATGTSRTATIVGVVNTSGACEPASSSLQGDVMPTGLVTICCASR